MLRVAWQLDMMDTTTTVMVDIDLSLIEPAVYLALVKRCVFNCSHFVNAK